MIAGIVSRVVAFALRFPAIVVVATLLVLVAGAIAIYELDVDSSPGIGPPPLDAPSQAI